MQKSTQGRLTCVELMELNPVLPEHQSWPISRLSRPQVLPLCGLAIAAPASAALSSPAKIWVAMGEEGPAPMPLCHAELELVRCYVFFGRIPCLVTITPANSREGIEPSAGSKHEW